MPPASVIRIESTEAKIGRLMKNVENTALPQPFVLRSSDPPAFASAAPRPFRIGGVCQWAGVWPFTGVSETAVASAVSSEFAAVSIDPETCWPLPPASRILRKRLGDADHRCKGIRAVQR